jgi:sortase A
VTDVGYPPISRMTKYYVRPGEHSHNARRRTDQETKNSAFRWLRFMLMAVGIASGGYYSYTIADQYLHQFYENWAFDQQIAGRSNVTIRDYVLEKTPLGRLLGREAPARVVRTHAPATRTESAPPLPATPPPEGALLGRIEIKRLNLSAMVRQGVDAKMLSVAVGHVPSTTLPGQPGNFAIAAHRDTLFRGLKDVKTGDLVTFESQSGTYTYKVLATKIVTPSDVSVLRADGGGLIQAAPTDSSTSPGHLLTMITCYPFNYVGSAPKRFIVQAELIERTASHCYTCG